MQIKIDQNDIGKVLKEFFPRANYADGKLTIKISDNSSGKEKKDSTSKILELENTGATIHGEVTYGTLSGNLDISFKLNPEGIDCTITLK